MDGQMDGWMDKWMNGQVEGWVFVFVRACACAFACSCSAGSCSWSELCVSGRVVLLAVRVAVLVCGTAGGLTHALAIVNDRVFIKYGVQGHMLGTGSARGARANVWARARGRALTNSFAWLCVANGVIHAVAECGGDVLSLQGTPSLLHAGRQTPKEVQPGYSPIWPLLD